MEAGLPKAGAQGVWGQPELHETLPQILKRERKKSFDKAVSQYCVISFIKMPTLEQNMLFKMLARVKRRKVEHRRTMAVPRRSCAIVLSFKPNCPLFFPLEHCFLPGQSQDWRKCAVTQNWGFGWHLLNRVSQLPKGHDLIVFVASDKIQALNEKLLANLYSPLVTGRHSNT